MIPYYKNFVMLKYKEYKSIVRIYIKYCYNIPKSKSKTNLMFYFHISELN